MFVPRESTYIIYLDLGTYFDSVFFQWEDFYFLLHCAFYFINISDTKNIELIPPKNGDKTLLQSALIIFSVRSSSLLNLKNRRLFALVNDPTLRNYCNMKRFVCLYSEIFVSQVWVGFPWNRNHSDLIRMSRFL